MAVSALRALRSKASPPGMPASNTVVMPMAEKPGRMAEKAARKSSSEPMPNNGIKGQKALPSTIQPVGSPFSSRW